MRSSLKKTAFFLSATQDLSSVAGAHQARSKKLSASALAQFFLQSLGSLASIDAHALVLHRLNELSSIGEPPRTKS